MDETTKEKESSVIPDETLNEVSGGIQAGFFYTGGPGEFGNTPSEEPAPQKPRWF